MRAALRGWVGAVEETTLDHLRHRDIDRGALVTLFARSLVRTVEISAAL